MATPALQLPPDTISAEDLLTWGYEEFGDRFCLTCSWQKQSSVLDPHGRRARPADRRRRARHAALLPGELRHARPAARALPRHAGPAARDHGRGAAQAGGPEPLGARPRPLLRDPQGRAARPRARALRRLGVRHPPRPVAEPRGHRRRSSGPSATASGSCTRSPTGTRSASGPTSRSTRFLTTRCTRPATGRSGASPAPGRRPRKRRSAQAAGPAPTNWSAAFTPKGTQ